MTLLLSALPLALFGGDTLAGFAWVMVVGIVISAGSSVFIAAPIVLFTGRTRLRRGDGEGGGTAVVATNAVAPKAPVSREGAGGIPAR
jgi:hypothetical protein